MFGKYEEDRQKGRSKVIVRVLRVAGGTFSLTATFGYAYLTGLTVREGGSFLGVVWCFMMYKMLQAFSDILFEAPSDRRTFLRRFIGKG